jgi:hypothetical protein
VMKCDIVCRASKNDLFITAVFFPTSDSDIPGKIKYTVLILTYCEVHILRSADTTDFMN